jgi:predicted ribosomally synthesized peptide with SipW-like signal peptide
MDRRKKLRLTAVIALGVLGLIGAGTFATFTAQVRNPSNVFATGTLVLSDKVNAGTACLSTGGGNTDTNVNNNCDTAFNLTVKKPGDSGSANITIKDEGSLDANVFKMFSAACTSANAVGENFHGTGDACAAVQLYVQQYSDSGFTTPSACIYGGAAGNTCNFSDNTKTLGDFATNYNSTANGLSLGTLTAGSSNYYKVAVQLAPTAGNPFQGRQATVDFTWYAAQ